MVLYSKGIDVSVPSITGGLISSGFAPWQPSTWPDAPKTFNTEFFDIFKRIIQESVLDELRNVVEDIKAAHQTTHPREQAMEHRGHVVAVACMCALDAVARYGYFEDKTYVASFVRAHFPESYRPFAGDIYPAYRLNLVHAWNLFGNAAMSPGDDEIRRENGVINFGILNFVSAFERAVIHFLSELETDKKLQKRVLERYGRVRKNP